MKYSKEDKERAREGLLELLKPGDTVYTVLNHVSRSGMMREISPYIIRNNEPRWIGRWAAVLMDAPVGKREGVKMGGCGMDMGFSLVYNLSYYLFPEGFDCIGEHCPSSDHSNGDRNYSPHHHQEGGYALRQRWM